jgi:steroid 5-alpha reductase family enzyme
MWIVSVSVQLAQYGHGDTVLGGAEVFTVIGVVLWLVGFGFETIGDLQLARFRADPSNQNQVLDTGLWRFTRHPNFFGDACVWWGLAMLAWHHEPGFFSVFAADAMTFLLVIGTGAKSMEKTIGARRPGYPDYMTRTSIFIPLPPKRSASPQSGD